MADGVTLGTPICVVVPNTDQRSGDYSEMAQAYRPSHADATYDMKVSCFIVFFGHVLVCC